MYIDLQGQTVVITGACGVTGRAYSDASGAVGSNVAAVDPADSEQPAKELREQGAKAIGVDADITSSSSPVSRFSSTAERKCSNRGGGATGERASAGLRTTVGSSR